MIVIIALFGNLLLDKISVQRPGFTAGRRGYMNVLSRGHG